MKNRFHVTISGQFKSPKNRPDFLESFFRLDSPKGKDRKFAPLREKCHNLVSQKASSLRRKKTGANFLGKSPFFTESEATFYTVVWTLNFESWRRNSQNLFKIADFWSVFGQFSRKIRVRHFEKCRNSV